MISLVELHDKYHIINMCFSGLTFSIEYDTDVFIFSADDKMSSEILFEIYLKFGFEIWIV